MNEDIKIDRRLGGRIAIIQFSFCDHNSFNLHRVRSLVGTLHDVLRDISVRAVVFASGADGYFSDGYSLEEMLGSGLRKRLRNGSLRSEDLEVYKQVQNLYAELIRAPIPTVSFVDGACYGAGFEWALSTDFVIATSRACFAFREVRLGIVPGLGGFQMLSMRVPMGLTLRTLMTGQPIDASIARSVTLADALVDDLDDGVKTFLAPMARCNPQALARMKSFVGVQEKKLAALADCRDAFPSSLVRAASTGIKGTRQEKGGSNELG